MYVREAKNGSLGHLLDELELAGEYLSDTITGFLTHFYKSCMLE